MIHRKLNKNCFLVDITIEVYNESIVLYINVKLRERDGIVWNNMKIKWE